MSAQIYRETNLAALPDDVKQIMTDAFTLIAARTYKKNEKMKHVFL